MLCAGWDQAGFCGAYANAACYAYASQNNDTYVASCTVHLYGEIGLGTISLARAFVFESSTSKRYAAAPSAA